VQRTAERADPLGEGQLDDGRVQPDQVQAEVFVEGQAEPGAEHVQGDVVQSAGG
jgi:hypothetical protein